MPVVSTGQITIVDVNDGLDVSLSANGIALAADTAGTVSSFAGAETTMLIREAGVDTTSTWSFYISATGGGISYRDSDDTVDRTGTGPINGQMTGTPGYVKVAALSQDLSYLDITAVKGTNTVVRRFSVAKARQGSTGTRGTITTSASTSGASWVDSEATAAISAAGGGSPVQGDVVTLYNTAQSFSQTRVRSSGGTWSPLTAFFGGDVIVDNTLAASKIVAGSITSDRIAAGSVTASKIAVGDFAVQARNWNFEEGDTQWTKETGWSVVSDAVNAKSGSWVARFTGTSVAALRNSQFVPAEAGEAFYAEAYVRHAAGSSGVGGRVRIQFRDAAGADISFANGNLVAGTTTTYTKSFIQGVAPANTATARVEVTCQLTAGTSYVDEVRLFRASGTTLIADGAITTTKIGVGEVKAGNIFAGAVTAEKIDALAVTAAKISAGAVTTDKLLVTGRGKALNDDPFFLDSSAWSKTSGTGSYALVTESTSPSGTRVLRATDDVQFSARQFPIVAGTRYKVTMWARRTAGTGSMYLRLYCYNAAGTLVNYVATPLSGTGDLENIAVPSSWTKYTGYVDAGSATVNGTLIVHVNWQTTGTTDVADCRVEEYIGADLIVDGAITATKLAANSIAVGTAAIQNLAITNSMIANTTITNAKIANLSVAKLTGAAMQVGSYIESTNFTTGANGAGWRINADGTAELQAAYIRGQVTASQINSNGLSIRDNSGNIILAAGTPLAASNITPASGWLNSNITVNSGTLNGIGTPSIQVDNSYQVIGQNLLPNSDMAARCDSVIGWNPNSADITSGPGRAEDLYAGSWSTANYLLIAGATRNGVVLQTGITSGTTGGSGNSAIACDIHLLGAMSLQNGIPVVPGKRYCVSAYVNTHRCNVIVGMTWLNTASAQVTPGYESAATTTIGDLSNRLDSYTRVSAFGVAPAGAVVGIPFIRKLNTFAGQSDSWLWWAAPMWEEVSTNAQGPSPYQPGPAVNARQVGFTGDLDAQRNNRISINADGSLNGAGGGQVSATGLGITGLTLINDANCSQRGDTIQKVSGGDAWNAGMRSREAFAGGAFASATAPSSGADVMFGLNSNATTSSYTDIDHAILLAGNNAVQVYEEGAYVGEWGTWSPGQTYTVRYDGTSIQYMRDGAIFHQRAVNKPDPLFFDSSLYQVGAQLRGVRFGPLSKTKGQNLLDSRSWIVNSGGSQSGFPENGCSGGVGANYITYDYLPDGSQGIIWRARSGNANGTSGEGGWNSNEFPIDHTKTYRFTVWMRKIEGNGSGSFYLGPGQSQVNDIGGGVNGNPYFISSPRSNLPNNEWVLVVGYVYQSVYAFSQLYRGGVYRARDGVKILDGNDFRWVSGQATSYHRAYQYYTTAEYNYIDFFDPRVELCDGTEPSIDQLLSMGSVSGRKQINSSNASTYIASAAIGDAQIANTIQSTNYSGSAGWQINKAGTATFNEVALRGAINGGAYTGWAWPASGQSGFHLGPNGLLLGNANDNKYFQATSVGNIFAPGFEIVNGVGTITDMTITRPTALASGTHYPASNNIFAYTSGTSGAKGYPGEPAGWDRSAVAFEIDTGYNDPEALTNVRKGAIVGNALVTATTYWYSGTAPGSNLLYRIQAEVSVYASIDHYTSGTSGSAGGRLYARIYVSLPRNIFSTVYQIRIDAVQWQVVRVK